MSDPLSEPDPIDRVSARAAIEAKARHWIEFLPGTALLRKSPGAQKALRSSAWSMGGYGVNTALRFTSRIVLAKFLSDASPMGNVAVVTTIIMGLEMISDLGIGINIVQHPSGAEPTFLRTAFSVQALRGVTLWAICSLLAYPIAWAYKDPSLGPLLLVAGVSVLMRGFASPALWTRIRQVDLRSPTLVTMASELVGFGVTIIWAINAPSPWAIVSGSVAAAAAYSASSHLVGARARFGWDRNVAGGIVRFGGWILLSTATYFLASRGEVLMLKGSVPDIEFGTFAFALMLVTTPTIAITQVASNVLLPILSASIRDDLHGGETHYVRAKWLFTALSLCVCWTAILAGPSLISILRLGPSYKNLGWMMQFLGVRAALDVYAAPATNVLLAYGASRYSASANLLRLAVLVIGLLLTVPRHGMSAAVWVLVGATALSYLALLPGLRRYMPTAMRLEFLTIILFLCGSGGALLLVVLGAAH